MRVLSAFAALALCAGVARTAAAQVSIPNIQNPINKAKAAAEKTNQQIDATNKVGAGIDAKGASTAAGPAAAAQAADQQRKAAAASAKVGAPAPQQKAGATPQKAAPAPGKAGAKPGKGDTATAVSQAGTRRGPQVTIYREAFSYAAGGRRDPFISLMMSGELRPIFSDLVLTGVIYDDQPNGRGSLALLIDASTGESYRRRLGETLGRMKITKIGREEISFSIDEFGLSRSETLIVDKTRKGPVAGRRP